MRDDAATLIHGITPAKVRAVVFDLGGVFLEGTVDNVRRFGERVGAAPDDWRAIHRELFIEEGPWNEVERGEMTLDAFAAILRDRLAAAGVAIGLEVARDFMGNPADSVSVRLRPEIVAAAQQVKRRLPIALLTNNIVEWRGGWRSRPELSSLFHQVVDSSEVGARKPEPAIYALMEQKLGMDGERLLFIDDLGVNLKAARARGWQTVKYDDTAKVLAVLAAVAEAGGA